MDALQNSMVGTSEWGTSINDFCQDWLLQNTAPASQLELPTENINASFPTLVDAVHYGVPTEPLYQDCFFNTPGATFQLESTFQPEPLEEVNGDPGKRPMSVSSTSYSNPINDASTSNVVEPMNTMIDHGLEFERHVEDSWAYISKLYSRKKKSAEASSSKAQRNVRSRRPYQFVKYNTTLVVFEEEMDLSEMPTPVCSCTGVPRTCRRWSRDGWISACCTATISMYPLPTYIGKSRIVRLQGRRMGGSVFTRVVEELLLEGYDLDCPIDLKNHWAKLGSNKYAVNK